MQTLPKSISLSYFDIIGRAQGIRDTFVDAGIDFEDRQIPKAQFEDRDKMRGELDAMSPYGSLPVLQWGEALRLPQTEAIAAFVGEQLGRLGGQDAAARATALSFVAFGHQDLLLPVAMLLWQPFLRADLDLPAALAATRARLKPRLEGLERQLNTRAELGSEYLSADTPTVGDFFVFEGVEAIEMVLGASVLQDKPQIRAFCERVRRRPRLQQYLREERPKQYCGSPVELEVREKLTTLC